MKMAISANHHPGAQEVAIVGLPNEWVGERACAFELLREGMSLTLVDLSHLMAEKPVAKTIGLNTSNSSRLAEDAKWQGAEIQPSRNRQCVNVMVAQCSP